MNPRTKQTLLKACMAVIVLLSSTLAPVSANAATTNTSSIPTRIGGVDQYETAALIAQRGWTGSTDNVVLSSGINSALVDALSAGPLAAKLKAPILLTDSGQDLNSFTKAELERLKPKKVYITSGTAVIKASAIEEIKALGITPVPLGGIDQYETSANIAKEMVSLGTDVTKVVVTAGWMAPVDALSVSSIAAALEIPILATTHDALPPSIKEFLNEHPGITDSYVIGGTAVVGEAIKEALPGTVHRYFGVTKFDTNLEVLKGFAKDIHYDKVYVANGDTFVDALSGVSLASLTNSPILLSQSDWSAAMKDFLKQNNLQEIVALGGAAVVPDNVLGSLTDISNEVSNSPTPPAASAVPSAGGGASSAPTPTAPTMPSTVTVSNLKVNTDPANSLGTFNNGAVIDLSGLDDSVTVLGFGLTADQDCTLQFKVLNNVQNIPLAAGVEKDVTIGDLITGGQIQSKVTLGEFRLIYTTKTLVGQLLKDGTSAGTLTVTLKFKN
ncbi:cell wall-binding repeat-containing protein [Desulfosporosinus sp. SB140]|uniref:cell wall-binding repeat-containing protein n=1 Tax=Desulfosporosinus paludis TaxID=3115649 RepID=UPI00388FE2D9